MKKTKNKIILGLIIIFLFLCFSVFVFYPAEEAQAFGKASTYLDSMAGRVNLKKNNVPQMIGSLIYGILGFLGIICLILIITAGIMWMTAGGNEESVKKARGIIKGAVLGVLVILAAYALAFFVLTVILENLKSSPKESESDLRVEGGIRDDWETGLIEPCSEIFNCYTYTTSASCLQVVDSMGFHCCGWDYDFDSCVNTTPY